MTTEITKAEYALLGLLIEKPSHGYDLEQTIQQRNMREWTELAFSSIYYILKRLQGKNLVETSAISSTGKRAKKIFSATDQGRTVHSQTTLEFLGQPEMLYPSVLLGMANWPSVKQQQGLDALLERKASLETALKHLEQRAEAPTLFVGLMFDYSLTHLNAEIAWIEKAYMTLKDAAPRIGNEIRNED